MAELTEIRWHGRGGQGVVTAAKLVAESALEQGKYFQATPEYGAERMGAPIQAFTRISDEPITLHAAIKSPNIVAVLDQSLLDVIDVTDGLARDGVLLVNTGCDPGRIREELNLKRGKIFTVDATGIALDTIKRPIPNTPMLGALIKATGIMKLEDVLDHLKKSFSKKFSKGMVDANIKAVEKAYKEVQSE